MKTQYRCNVVTAEGKAYYMLADTPVYRKAHQDFMDYLIAMIGFEKLDEVAIINIEAVEVDDSSDQ